jgi:hypothetical protein
MVQTIEDSLFQLSGNLIFQIYAFRRLKNSSTTAKDWVERISANCSSVQLFSLASASILKIFPIS